MIFMEIEYYFHKFNYYKIMLIFKFPYSAIELRF